MIKRLLLITFLQSFATICMERGIYFFTHDRLHFSDAANLWLALVWGVTYVVGALSSHPHSQKFRERPVLLFTLGGQMVLNVLLGCLQVPWLLFVCMGLIGYLNGTMWPIIESFVSAGKGPRKQAQAIGQFNVSWALSIPPALVAVGPLIAAWVPSLFLIPGAINIACLLMCLTLPKSPVHMPPDDAERPDLRQLLRLKALLISNRWLMLVSYALLFLLAPLLPRILTQLGAGEQIRPALSGLLDFCRLAIFLAMGAWIGWHGRVWPLVVCMIAMPVGLFVILFGGSLSVVLGGEVLFGLSAGTIYFGSLYYSMVVQNASVEGGGAHEGLIGMGFAVGPAIGLVSAGIAPMMVSNWNLSSGPAEIYATLLSVGPVLVICSLAACWPLIRSRRMLGKTS